MVSFWIERLVEIMGRREVLFQVSLPFGRSPLGSVGMISEVRLAGLSCDSFLALKMWAFVVGCTL